MEKYERQTYKGELLGLLSALALLAMLAFSASVYAGPGAGGFGGPGFGMRDPSTMIERMADHLDLDETQRQSVANIAEAAKPEFQALRDSVRANRQALAALDPADANYSVDLNSIAADNGRLATEATLLVTRVRNDVKAVLTEEQRAKLEERNEERKQRMRDRRERRSNRQ